MQIFTAIVTYLESLAYIIPLELFVIIGSFVEEIIAPIPSPVVMVLAGSLASAQGKSVIYLLWLAFLGAIGKTLGSWILYLISDRLKDLLLGRFGKFIGVTPDDVEIIGKRLKGGWQDNVFIFLARAIPIFPSAPVSIACGILKIDMRTFLVSTLAGSFVRDMIYLYFGYIGLENYEQIVNGFDGVESIIQIVLFILIALVIGWAYYKRHKLQKQK